MRCVRGRKFLPTCMALVIGIPVWHVISGLWFYSITGRPDANATEAVASEIEVDVMRHEETVTKYSIERHYLRYTNVSDILHDINLPKPSHITVIGRHRATKGYLTIGIPTVKRKGGTMYIQNTLQALVDRTSPAEKMETVIFVFVADNDQQYRSNVVKFVRETFQEHMDSGFIQVLFVSQDLYPKLEGLKRNYNDPSDRVKWRSKQVVDFAFMFYYGRNLSQYYIQIEDDVICAPNYIPAIKQFVTSQGDKWTTLDFSELGFIGKLYKSSDLERLAKFLLMFYEEQPVDWLFRYFHQLLTQSKIILRKPTLFQHMGKVSSLDSKKMNNLKDRFFQASLPNPVPQVGDNPPASICSSFTTYQSYSPDFAYSHTDSFFWATALRGNETFFLIFKNAVKLKKVTIETGHPSHSGDYLRSGRLDASPTVTSEETNNCTCDHYVTIGEFVTGQLIAEGLKGKLPFVTKCLRLSATNSQTQWVIIKHIAVYIEM